MDIGEKMSRLRAIAARMMPKASELGGIDTILSGEHSDTTVAYGVAYCYGYLHCLAANDLIGREPGLSIVQELDDLSNELEG